MSIQQHFEPFPKIARLSRECIITEKIDGTNAQIVILADDTVLAGSRSRIITPEDDNFGFARWVRDNADALREGLGAGRHFGEWWGSGIQRGYGLKEKRFSLFNCNRWNPSALPDGVFVVPELYRGEFHSDRVTECVERLRVDGSAASPGFMNPEGVVVFHVAAQTMFKKTLCKDEEWKGRQEA